jgi:Uma2 family endonuclease
VKRERWDALTPEQREKFVPLCPDFVVEIRSRSDSVDDLHAKLREYIANGAALGFLIDPYARHVHVYRPGAAVESLEDPREISGEPVLAGFVLDANVLW